MKIARVIVSAAAAVALMGGGAQVAGAQEKEPVTQTAQQEGSAEQLSSLSSAGFAQGDSDSDSDSDSGDEADADAAQTVEMSSDVAADVFGPLAPLVLALAPLLAGLLGVLDVITDALGGIAHLGFAAAQ